MTLMTDFVVQGHTHYIYIQYSGIYLLVEFSSIMGNVVFFLPEIKLLNMIILKIS